MTSHTSSTRYTRELLEPWPEHRHRFTVREGRKHDHLLLDGRMVMVLPRAAKLDGRRARNAAALLRRLLRC